MVRLLFAEMYEQEKLGESEHMGIPVASTSTSTANKRPRFRLSEQTASERRAVEGLLPINPPSFVSRRHGRGFSDRLGLGVFLRQLKSRVPVGRSDPNGAAANTSLKYPHHWPRDSGSPGPEKLPNSVKAVCMLYCFTIGSLREIRNDILAGKFVIIIIVN